MINTYLSGRSKIKVTVFGSCRQDAIYDTFAVTSIREKLTYPHYTKEVLQAIEFCRGEFRPPRRLLKVLFRYPLVRKRSVRRAQLRRDFWNTDLFVIEIASRIEYILDGHFCHHIVKEEKYGVKERSRVIVRDATDKEIEDDLLQIRQILLPRPFFVVSHFYTRQTGKRYELVKLLEKICSKHGIPFLDPAKALESHSPSELYVDEPVLSHYTSRGKSLIGEVYNNFIEQNFPELIMAHREHLSPRQHSLTNFLAKKLSQFLRLKSIRRIGKRDSFHGERDDVK